MTRPQYRVEVAFSSDPDDPSPVWVDITDDVRGKDPITMSRGRQDEFASVEPGRMGLTLNNASGDYTWGRANSRFFPGVLPGRRVRVSLEIPDPPMPPPTPESRVRLFGLSITPTRTVPGGSLPPGQASYPAPSGAIYVATTGSDSTGTGAVGTPYATIGKAVGVAASGSTIVVREGSYHEGATAGSRGNGISVSTASLTLQSYPGEEVWLDGSIELPTWTLHATGVWKHAWAHTFDRSGTYSWGGSSSGVLVNPTYPLASYPEQFWADDLKLTQVATLGEVAAGKFYVDLAADLVYVGTDPTGKTMRGSDLAACLTVLGGGAGFTMRGIGVRKYSNQCPDFGVIKLNRANCTLEHVWIEDVATTGVYWYNGSTASHNLTLRRVTVKRAGQMGLGGTQADDILLDHVLTEGCNESRFAGGQSAGSCKITRTKRVRVLDSSFSGALDAPGLWFDQSVYDVTVAGCDSIGNGTSQYVFENCTKALFVNNLAAGGTKGFHVLGADQVQIWNCTATNTTEPMVLQQDDRTPANTPENLDSRYPGDTTVDWYINAFTMCNTILAKTTTGAPHWRVKSIDLTPPRDWDTFGITSDGNVINRDSGSNSVVSVCTASGESYYSWSAYRTATGLDAGSVFIDGSYALDPTTYLPTSSAVTAIGSAGVPLPSTVAALAGVAAGTVKVGHWQRP